jgi:hypothetical protein
MSAPKLFVSYCWSSQDHEQWVLDLAIGLRENGIDVILDKWHLREGNDAVHFMEQMVTDPEIKKVIMICDQKYAAKADGREGGVGTETTIISKQVYENQSQDKFVAVLSERDPDGRPPLPTYYASKIYIDLSNPDNYVKEHERLVRWVFDKPLYVPPEIGKMPAYLSDVPQVSLGTTQAFRRALDAIKNGRPHASGALDEYCALFSSNLERFRITSDGSVSFDELVIRSIDEFIPYRNEAIQIIEALGQYGSNTELVDRIHRMLEDCIPYLDRPDGVSQWMEREFDNFSFILQELFLYALAIFVKHQKFEYAASLLAKKYYAPKVQADRGLSDPMVPYSVFYRVIHSFNERNQRSRPGRVSIRADFLKSRSTATGVRFQDLMQADFIAFLRSELESHALRLSWVPETLVFWPHHSQQPFELFARSSSRAFFERSKVLLGIGSKADLVTLFEKYREGRRRLPQLGYATVEPGILLGYENLATDR